MGKNGCVKCGHTEAQTKEIATTGTGLSRYLDVQHKSLYSGILHELRIFRAI